MEWVLTTERLPPMAQRCVIITDLGIWEVAWLQEPNYFRTEFSGYPTSRVVRWVLLPPL